MSINLRLPADLHETLKRQAEEDGRSLSNYTIRLLWLGVREQRGRRARGLRSLLDVYREERAG